MQETSALWKTYQAGSIRQYRYRAVVDGQEYLLGGIWSIGMESHLCDDQEFSIGNVFDKVLNLSIIPKPGVVIPKMSSVNLFVGMSGTGGDTEWIPKGQYFIDNRYSKNKVLKVVCRDKVPMLNKPFIQSELVDDFPMLMTDAVQIICSRLGIPMDNMSAIQPTFRMEYPNDMTMRDVLGYIASANAGNFYLRCDGTLRLVVPVNGASVANVSHRGVANINDVKSFGIVTMMYDDTNAFASGTTGDELVVKNPWATQEIVDYVRGVLSTYTHRPFDCTQAYFDPAVELGDTVTIDGAEYVLYSTKDTFGTNIVSDISSPGETEVESEYPYEGSYDKALKSKATLGESYHGVIISRDKGIEVIRSDGSGQVVLNTEEFVMRTLVDGILVDNLFFDPVKKRFVFAGEVSADAAILGSINAGQLTTGTIKSADGSIEINLSNGQFILGAGVISGDKTGAQYHAKKGTFGDEGLVIEQVGAKTRSVLNEVGLKVQDLNGSTAKTILFAGVDTDGRVVVTTAFIDVSEFAKIGQYTRMQDYGTGRTGVFYVG